MHEHTGDKRRKGHSAGGHAGVAASGGDCAQDLRGVRLLGDPRPGHGVHGALCPEHRRFHGHRGEGDVHLRGPRREKDHAPARRDGRRGAGVHRAQALCRCTAGQAVLPGPHVPSRTSTEGQVPSVLSDRRRGAGRDPSPCGHRHYRDALKAYLQGKLPTLCADCQRRYETNPLRVLDCKVDADKFGDSPVMLDHLCGPCKSHFETVEQGLRTLGIPFEVNTRLVRGLDYYTRTTFELVMGHMGAQNTVAAGGRYDGLVEEIGGPPTPGIGFALGVERALSLLDTNELRAPRPALFIAALGPEAASFALPLIHGLKFSGVPADTDYAGGSLKSQMKKADRSGSCYTLIIGEQEMKEGKAVLRNMQTKEQDLTALEGIVETLRSRLSRDI